MARTPESCAAEAGALDPLAAAVSLAYVALAMKYWFRTPIFGCALSVAQFATARVRLALAGR